MISRRALIFGTLFLCIVGAGLFAQRYYRRASTLKSQTQKSVPASGIHGVDSGFALAPSLLGFRGSRTYLLLFQNHTELRPAGGFIGSYGILTLENGKVKAFSTQGTEILDGSPAAKKLFIPPPEPMRKYLGVSRWLFRDSNWSPDFATSAAQALEFYRREEGPRASDLSAVVGITPEMLSQMLKITGPITIAETTFTAENVTDALEYEVEKGYREDGIPKRERKEIIGEFGRELLYRLSDLPPGKWGEAKTVVERMLRERQVMVYATDEKLQEKLQEEGWTGRVRTATGDFIMVVDANLSALKTDRVLDRAIAYSLIPDKKGFRGRVEITYDHKGVRDWRTSRYQTYTRVYLPKGSVFISSEGARDPVDVGEELGHTVFGTRALVEPQSRGTLTFEFALAPQIAAQIRAGAYTLFVQKQAGTLAHGLTLDLNFGKTVIAAAPAEEVNQFGDTRYKITTNLQEDRGFAVRLR